MLRGQARKLEKVEQVQAALQELAQQLLLTCLPNGKLTRNLPKLTSAE